MKRMRMVWLGAVALGTYAALAVGCSSTGDSPLEKDLDRVGSTSQAQLLNVGIIPSRVDCNQQGTVTTKLVAHQLGQDPNGNPVYQRLLGDLLTDLSGSCVPDFGATKCQQWHDYTAAVYSQIYGAAGYYYRVDDMFIDGDGGQMMQGWIAIPIVDITTPQGYYPTPPLKSQIHTPLNSVLDDPWFFYGTAGTNAQPFWLRAADHTSLWQLVANTSLNTSNVSGRVRSEACIAIVDPAGNFLDYSAELEEHDPNGCGGCRY